ncbi:hypothetical protein H257_05432 [Aphanomyces astaci]|uniref:Amino acid permease/ SLC12A domain-containing protein n=1 Tax=Aphanomyces astaci TaxID=112090 RepID=W4GSK6_APHAT|nr:hypothetical protein H257_05432 [Aphanomyces astaci]ETV81878.1 hypothetical protein H257_05432 [Aphanomyces astaci]RQM30073.1 hypothetical protein B5M09_012523 [Aphanomyces astaci]|eukprot:XP_009828615.1 hypothetical protein H257_05432 [Aphanomyces astaci]
MLPVVPLVLTKQASSFRERIQHAHSSVDLWAMGITIVIGGQFFSWNAGLTCGTVSFGLSVLVMGAAYVCLACSLSEISSMLPFAGGAYGLSRCTLGFFPGFILGSCEVLEYILYVSSVNVMLGKTVAAKWPVLEPYVPLVWLAAYVVAFGILTVGGRLFWRINLVFAVALMLQLVIYVVGSATYVDIAQQGGGAQHYVVGGLYEWCASFPMAMWFYVGIEALNTLCNEVDNPRATIPRGQLTAIATVCTSAIAVYFVAISLPPGVASLSSVLNVLNGGFTQILGISDQDASLLNIPALFATMPGLLLATGNIITALAESKLVPYRLHRRHETFGTPARAMAAATTLSFALCFCAMYQQNADTTMYYVSMFFGCMTYISQCIGYIFLSRRYHKMPRSFRSPFGVAGAMYAMIVFSISALSILACQNHSYSSTVAIAGILTALSVYYHGYAKSRQSISEDERKLLFFAHVANHNNAKKKQHQKANRRKKGLFRILAFLGRRRSSVIETSMTKKACKSTSVAPTQMDVATSCSDPTDDLIPSSSN